MTTEIVSTEPATGEVFWRGPVSDVSTEVDLARTAFAEWASRPLANRVEAMRRFVNVVRGKHDAFADTIARENGKPLWEARTEVDAVIAKVEISIESYSERTSQRRLDGDMRNRQSLRHKPHGVMAVLGPYNFPAHLPNGHIIPALIAGNAVVFKPSEQTPASGQMLVDCYHEAGVPDGVVRCVIGGPDTGRALVAHPDIDGVLFTGSARTGIAINRQFADDPGKILALEMGGNNPIIVWDAPDVYAAATLVIQSAFMSAGQRCTAASRLIVRDGLHEPLIAQIKRLCERLIIDEPHATPAPFMGPVIDNAVADQLEEDFLALIMKGGVPILHMERLVPGRPFLSPALIDMTDASDRPDIELFGPVLQVVRVPDFESALVEANNTRYGLAASLVGGTPELYEQFWANIRAGIVNWNKPTNGASSKAPFGGIGLSGNHRPSAYYAADYCAYPVVSSEDENARASITIGLRDPDAG